MEAVIRFELNVQADVDAFRRVHHRVMRSLLDAPPFSAVEIKHP